jgi:Ca-activated chloride channel family protein
MELKPSNEAYKSFRKSQIGTVLSSEQPSRAQNRHTQFAISQVAGKLPEARLVVLNGDQKGRRFELVQPRIVLGRTSAADIPIEDPKVSRQHLAILGKDGRFLAQDLGATNASYVNGALLSRPVPLSPGDVIRVGSVELRYEEGK